MNTRRHRLGSSFGSQPERLFDTLEPRVLLSANYELVDDRLYSSDAGHDTRDDGFEFGDAVDIDGDTAIVGAPDTHIDNGPYGAAYIFQRAAGTTDEWSEVARLMPPDGESTGLGDSVAIDGDFAAVGAPNWLSADEQREGAVHVYHRNAGGADQWGLVATLISSLPSPLNDYFARDTVSMDDGTIVVGAPQFWNDGNGYAEVYQLGDGGVTDWHHVTRLTSSSPDERDDFGVSVDISGDRIVVGSDWDANDWLWGGSVFVFERAGETWSETARIWPNNLVEDANFGAKVALDGDRLIVGNLNYGEVPEAVWIFEYQAGQWVHTQTIEDFPDASGNFGEDFAIEGDLLVIGDTAFTEHPYTTTGRLLVFEHEAGNWSNTDILEAPYYDGRLGSVFALSGPTIFAGRPTDRHGDFLENPRRGSAVLFVDANWTGDNDGGGGDGGGGVRPTLDSLTGSAVRIAQGDQFMLIANSAADSDGTVSEVRFYLDRNGDGVATADELLGTDTDGSNGYRFTIGGAQTAGYALGGASFLAEAVDNEGLLSPVRALQATVVFSVRAGEGAVVRGSSTTGDVLWVSAVNRAGDPLIFNATSRLTYHLGLEAGAPRATSDMLVWTDPNDGLVYAAYPSAEGFILVRRAAGGTWSYRNLSVEVGNTDDAPAGTLAHFATRPKTGTPLLWVAGFSADGQIVAFQQTGSTSGGHADWSFVNISDDLASRGLATPVLTEMVSYVTSWNQWTLAGLDASGNVQGVWVNVATFTTWTVNNLSSITGAAPLVGQLDVTLTTWGGIRFAGANSSGRLVATWWNPALGGGNWKQTDLSDAVPGGAPQLTTGKLTAWFTPSNLISYAGFDGNGDITTYYWKPGDGGVWSSDNLTDFIADPQDRPTGTITSHVSDAETVSLLGVDSRDNATRLWLTIDNNNVWRLTNLSDRALRA